MAQELYANSASTTVPAGADGNTGNQTWVVESSIGFPSAVSGVSQFHVSDPAAPTEVILVTNMTGTGNTAWSVTRGAEATTPVPHDAGFTVTNVITAGWLNTVTGGTLPTVAAGAVLYGNPSAAAAWLAGDVTGTKQFLTSTGSGGTATAPAWGTIASADVPVLNQNTTGTSANVTGTVATINGGTGLASFTAYTVVTGGTSATTPLQQVAAAGTVGQVLTSNGAGQLPSWQTPSGGTGGSVSFPITVAEGGTGGTQATAYAVVVGGTASTSPFQQVATAGTIGQVLTSNGAGQLPTWQPASGGSSVSFPITVNEGGTGGTQATAYALIVGGTAATTPFQQVATLGSSGQVLTSQGAGSLPTWTTVATPAVQSVTTSGTDTYTLAAASYGAFNVTLGAASVPTFDFTGLSAGNDVSFTVVFTQPAGGGVTVAWGTSVTWIGGVTPQVNTDTGAISVFVFQSVDGATWLGTMVTGPTFNGAATSPVGIIASAGESVISSATIVANLAAGATYRITTWGTIATLSTSGTTIMKTRLGGLAGTQVQTFTSASLTSSSTYSWRSVAEVTLQVPGSSGIWAGDLTAIQNIQGSAATTYLANPATATVDSTTAQVFAVTLNLSGTASTAACLGSTWERVA